MTRVLLAFGVMLALSGSASAQQQSDTDRLQATQMCASKHAP
jgi:hypothetical protein